MDRTRPSLALALVLVLVGASVSWAGQQAAAPTPPPATPSAGDSTRLFYGPTGRMLEPDEVYVADYSLFLPFIQVGVTRRFSIGAGAAMFGLGGGDGLYWVTPKLQVYQGARTSVALGTLSAFVPNEGGAGLAYVVATREAGRNAFTFGAGWGYAADEGDLRFSSGAPLVVLGFERRLTRRTTFVSENYILWDVGLLTGGVRVQGEHLSADFLGFFVFADGDLFAAPTFNLAWRF